MDHAEPNPILLQWMQRKGEKLLYTVDETPPPSLADRHMRQHIPQRPPRPSTRQQDALEAEGCWDTPSICLLDNSCGDTAILET
jgi:hypothetical protein